VIRLGSHDALDLALYRRIVYGGEQIELVPDLLQRVDERRAAMLRALEAGVPAYGVTTGLGYMAKHEIPAAEQLALQRSILLGRSVALGDALPTEVVRGAMLLRLVGFLSGDAGVSSDLCRLLADRVNDLWAPYVPAGPHGAAGEVIPLSHLFQTLVGEGFVLERGVKVPAHEALAARGLDPYRPDLKEGAALVNGAPLAPALTISLVDRARPLLEHATLAAALTTSLTGASARPFSPRIGRLNGDSHQVAVQVRLLELLGGGDLADRAQAPVSLRVVPQVHGALLAILVGVEARLEHEVRAVSDSPLYLLSEGAEPEGFYPSGNFHSQALAFELDLLAIAFAQLANLGEKRLHRLLDARYSGFPDQLSLRPGTQTGASVLHKAVVALCAENRMLATPASLNAGDTSFGQEDFEAFAFLAADKFRRVLDNVELVLAYELLALRQARHLRDEPLPSALALVCDELAALVEPLEADRPLGTEVERLRDLVRSGRLLT
jgi:histidine ammonia-lyase